MRKDLKRWDDFGGQVGRHCRDCEERHPGCHGSCERYLQAREEYKEYKEVCHRNRNENLILYRHHLDSIRKAEKSKR